MHVRGVLNGIPGIKILVDTSASTNVIYAEKMKQVGVVVDLNGMKVLKGIRSQDIATLGQITLDLKLGLLKVQLCFDVIEGHGKAILRKGALAGMKLWIDVANDRLISPSSREFIECNYFDRKQEVKRGKVHRGRVIKWRVREVRVTREKKEGGQPKEDPSLQSYTVNLNQGIVLYVEERKDVHIGTHISLNPTLCRFVSPRAGHLLQ